MLPKLRGLFIVAQQILDAVVKRCRAWASLVLKVAGVRVILENKAVIDSSLPQVLVTNHVSWIDVLVLAAFVPGRYVFVAKKEVERIPVFGAAGACVRTHLHRSR
ncbi:MAG: hypothetical protein CM1200mP14_22290 [Gammaproteobacteria bacterium]|nr:MAG: hypothetical protein CM1200mP14_22290 [Gammaproteobacteria bacterium]